MLEKPAQTIARSVRWLLCVVAFTAVSVGCGSGDAGGGTGGSRGSGGTAGGTGGAPGSGGAGTGGMTGSGGAPGSGGAIGSGGAGVGTGGTTAGTGGRGAGGGGAAGSAVGGSAGAVAGSGGRGGAAGVGGGAGGGGRAGSGSGGMTGAGGTTPGTCPTALVGWATVSGDGVSTTTGGGSAAPVRPTTAAELMTYASDAMPRVIEISGTFSVPRLQINSNKTLIGVGANATINGGLRIRGSSSDPISNVIVRNLRINGATTDVDDDAVQIYFAHHVWIDHCDIWDGPDGNLDMTHAVNWITVSWTKFRYTSNYRRPDGESSDHRFSSLLGHSDGNASEDEGRIKVTFHHNWWAEGVIERMPRVRFGQVHVFNNYFSSANNNYCVRAGTRAQLLVEGNAFDGVDSPHEFNSTEDETTASITQRNNLYMNTSGTRAEGGGGPKFTSAPYDATIEPASGIPTVVRACAGPR